MNFECLNYQPRKAAGGPNPASGRKAEILVSESFGCFCNLGVLFVAVLIVSLFLAVLITGLFAAVLITRALLFTIGRLYLGP